MLIAISCATFNKAIALIDFKLNQNYIATTLCENKDKPACCCHGKCFLKKQLQKDEDSDKNKSSNSKDKFEVSLFCETANQHEQIEFNPAKNFSDNYLLKKSSSFISSVFHPPAKS
jgi:hypothetical protein